MRVTLCLVLLLLLPASTGRAQDPAKARAQINRLIRQGLYDKALRRAAVALAKTPKDLSLRLLAAQSLYLRAASKVREQGQLTTSAADDLRMCLEQAGRVLTADPTHRDGRLVKAQAHYLGGQLDEAEKAVDRILAGDARDGGGNFLKATILFDRSGRLVQQAKVAKGAELRGKAAGYYRKALANGKKKAECLRRLGDIAATDGDLDQALKLYQRALCLDSTQAPHNWLLQQCKPAKAIPIYRMAGKKRLAAGDKQGAARLMMYTGFFHEVARQWQEARKAALRALELDPEGCWFCRYRAGWCSWWLEEREQAKRAFLDLLASRRKKFCDYLRAIGPEGKTAAAMMNKLAADAQKAGRLGEARDLSLLRAIIRGLAEDWNNYGFLCRETRRYEEAWVGYRRAIEKEPTNPRYLNDGALILHYHLHRQLEYAEKLYKKALEEGRRIIKDRESTPAQKSMARSAVQDALGNLRKMQRAR